LETPPIAVSDYLQKRKQRLAEGEPIHLLWAARWEHDKNPADLLRALVLVQEQGVNFRLSVIGEQFRKLPDEFELIRKRFQNSIVHWGYQSSRDDYWRVLADADVFVSTAQHEFFGIAAAEAISVGLYPLLPNRLAYPELIRSAGVETPGEFLFDGSPADLASRVVQMAKRSSSCLVGDFSELPLAIRSRCKWSARASVMDQQLLRLATGPARLED
jgi:glycosyltransferase involved in cell wall biosynthesis